MTNEQIEAIALANGFKLKEQPDGSMALNPYVFEFARALVEPMKELAAREALAAWLEECLSAMRHASEFLDESDKDAALALHRMNSLSSRSRGQDASLACRDARMKAEALEECDSDVMGLEEYQLGWRMEMRSHLKRKAAQYRIKAEALEEVGPSLVDILDRNQVKRQAAKYRKQEDGAIARNYPKLSITDEITEWTPRHQKAAEDLQLRRKVAVACDHIEGAEFVAWLNSVGYDAKLSDDYHDYVGGKDTAVYDEANEKMRDLWNRYCDEA